jgi:hypothetical protein
MRDSLKSSRRWSSDGWFWGLVVLALPCCSLDSSGLGTGRASVTKTTAIFCDIEKPVPMVLPPVVDRHCASDAEIADGVRLAAAAVALNNGDTNQVGLDYSPASLTACAGGPEAVIFQGPFPEGQTVCVDPADIGPSATFADATAVCAVRCQNSFGTVADDDSMIPTDPPDPLVVAYCASHSRVSTNVPTTGFASQCSAAGMLLDSFAMADPRRVPEPVDWVNTIGVAPTGGGSLQRFSDPFMDSYDAGAASSQFITHGDGFVEFEATETNTARLGGLSTVPLGDPPDTDPNYLSMGFAIALYFDSRIFLFESGTRISEGADPDSSFGTYATGQRFRVNVKDNFDGTATIIYSRLTGPCTPGTACPEVVLRTAGPASYPFRVDSSFREENGTLTNVVLVRIQ